MKGLIIETKFDTDKIKSMQDNEIKFFNKLFDEEKKTKGWVKKRR